MALPKPEEIQFVRQASEALYQARSEAQVQGETWPATLELAPALCRHFVLAVYPQTDETGRQNACAAVVRAMRRFVRDCPHLQPTTVIEEGADAG
jgi:hypothetical protein